MKNRRPTIVLPALSAPTSRGPLAGRKGGPKSAAEKREKAHLNWVAHAHQDAVDDLRTLTDHVLNLLNHPAVETTGVCLLLHEIKSDLNDIGQVITAGDTLPPAQPSIEDDNLSSLDHLLHQLDSWSNNWPDTPETALLEKLVKYWLGEIVTRGFSLIDLLTGTAPAQEKAAALNLNTETQEGEVFRHMESNQKDAGLNAVWNNCTADVVYYSDREAVTHDEGYEVRIDDQEIVVGYHDDEGWVEYRGKNNGDGHFHLTAPERDGKATLHRFSASDILEGYWVENTYRGMWRIRLKD